MKCSHVMVDYTPQKHVLRFWNQSESPLWHGIWNTHTSGTSRHQNTKKPVLEKRLERAVCDRHSAFKHTLSTAFSSSKWPQSAWSSINTVCPPQKVSRALARQGWGQKRYLPLALVVAWRGETHSSLISISNNPCLRQHTAYCFCVAIAL